MNHIAFFISDGTGITVEALGHSLLSRFNDLEVDQITLPYVNTLEKAHQAAKRISVSEENTQAQPIVVISIVSRELRDIIKTTNALVLDMFEAFLEPLESLFKRRADRAPGSAFGMHQTNYHQRIQAINFVLDNDDGCNINNYAIADVILIGLSRSGKTPTCIYLGMHYGLFAANFPFTEDELDKNSLPKSLEPYRNKLFGLLIDAERLASIRQERYANSRYASKRQCEFELRQFKNLLQRNSIPYLDSTSLSIEELSTKIITAAGIERRTRG